jgi:predicted amidohydrolase YtcJ
MTEILLKNAQVRERGSVDVRIREGRIAEIDRALRPDPDRDEEEFDARGGALLPGLNDHHIHLYALAAARRSVICGPPEVSDARQLSEALRQAERPDGWIRGIAYHESVAGDLDRDRLDDLAPRDTPVRIQHRSGALWSLNSAAIETLEPEAADGALPEGVQRDTKGRWTGRIYYEDTWLRQCLARRAPPDLGHVSRKLAACGVTGVTDATPGRGDSELELLADAIRRGELSQRVVAMADAGAKLPAGSDLSLGPVKIMLREPVLPEFDALVRTVALAHAESRPVAVHCVTRAELVLAATAIAEAGRFEGDRIEHASVAPPELVDLLAESNLWVVTQPGFIFERGDQYESDVEFEDRRWLYRGRGFLDRGVALAGGSDAPYGEADPWIGIRAAVSRATRSGHVMGRAEALSPERAVSLFTSPLLAAGMPGRSIEVGAPADLCVLDRPWEQAREILSKELVALTLLAGRPTWRRGQVR